jgi:hypothetical protein
VGAVMWLHLQRAAFSKKSRSVCGSLKGFAVACLHGKLRESARSAQHGNSIPLL